MNPLEQVAAGTTAEKLVTVTPEMTVGHAVPGMPEVTGTPTMILHMEMAAGSAVQPFLPAGHVNVSTSAIWRRHRSAERSDETRPRCAAPWRTISAENIDRLFESFAAAIPQERPRAPSGSGRPCMTA
jgi:hypothetical protein